MTVEKYKFGEGEKKKKEKVEQEERLELAKQLLFKNEKDKLLEKIEKDKKLIFLKSIIKIGLLKPYLIEKVLEGDDLTKMEIKEIFDKIDEIENITNIDEILPKELRITKYEYLEALGNKENKLNIMVKLEESLSFLSQKFASHSGSGPNLFRGLIWVLNKNINPGFIKVQENMIDIKRSLLVK